MKENKKGSKLIIKKEFFYILGIFLVLFLAIMGDRYPTLFSKPLGVLGYTLSGLLLIFFTIYKGKVKEPFGLMINIMGFLIIFISLFLGGKKAAFGSFSLLGFSNFLYFAFLILLISLFLLELYYFIREKILLYLFLTSLLLFIIFITTFNSLLIEEILLIILCFFSLGSFIFQKCNFSNKEELSNFRDLVFYYSLIPYFSFIPFYKKPLIIGALTIIYLFKIYKDGLDNKISETDYLFSLVSNVSVLPLFIALSHNNVQFVTLFSLFQIITYIVAINMKNKNFRVSGSIISNIILALLLFLNFSNKIELIIITSTFLILNLLVRFFGDIDDYKFENNLTLLKAVAFIFSLLNYLIDARIGMELSLSLLSILTVFIYLYENGYKLKKFYLKQFVFTNCYFLITTNSLITAASSLTILISNIIMFYLMKDNKDKKYYFLLMLLFIWFISLSNIVTIYGLSISIFHWIYILGTIIIALFSFKDNKAFRISLITGLFLLFFQFLFRETIYYGLLVTAFYLLYLKEELIKEEMVKKNPLFDLSIISVALILIGHDKSLFSSIMISTISIYLIYKSYRYGLLHIVTIITWLFLSLLYHLGVIPLNISVTIGLLFIMGIVIIQFIKKSFNRENE